MLKYVSHAPPSVYIHSINIVIVDDIDDQIIAYCPF